MAKTGIWLRGARGKLAGKVLFKGENATIIRENVKPHNPQTASQMLQRVAFATVSQAAKFMLPVIGQTFQGAGNEKKNRREFFKANVTKLKKAFDRYNGVTAGTAPLFPDYTAANPKGIPVLVPNRYIMSRGQLSLPNHLTPEVTVNALEQTATFGTLAPMPSGVINLNVGDALNPLVLIEKVWGLKLGQQLTFSCINTANGTNVASFDENFPDFARYANFKSARLVITDDEDVAAEAAVNITAATTVEQLVQAVKACINEEKSDSGITQAFLDVTSTMLEVDPPAEQGTEFNINYGVGEDNIIFNIISNEHLCDTSFEKTVAFSVILSENSGNAWNYSNSEMAIIPKMGNVVTSNDSYYGYDYLNAYKTYVKQADDSSQLYTRSGGLDNSVG